MDCCIVCPFRRGAREGAKVAYETAGVWGRLCMETCMLTADRQHFCVHALGQGISTRIPAPLARAMALEHPTLYCIGYVVYNVLLCIAYIAAFFARHCCAG